jgi:hypothetical protein
MTNTTEQTPPARKTIIVPVRSSRDSFPDPADPRLVDYESGKLIAAAINPFVFRTGVTIPQIAEKIGIGKENIYAYRRGHQVPSDTNRMKLERFLGLANGALKSSGAAAASSVSGAEVSRKIVGDELVITTTIRIPLSDIR